MRTAPTGEFEYAVWNVAGVDGQESLGLMTSLPTLRRRTARRKKSAAGHRTERSATTSPEVVVTADTLAVIWHAVAKAYPKNKRHGLPGCRHSQGSTRFVSFDRAGLKPGAVLFELLVLRAVVSHLDLIRPPPCC